MAAAMTMEAGVALTRRLKWPCRTARRRSSLREKTYLLHDVTRGGELAVRMTPLPRERVAAEAAREGFTSISEVVSGLPA